MKSIRAGISIFRTSPTDAGPGKVNDAHAQEPERLQLYATKRKMLFLVGLGLADETDITVRGLEVVKKAERVYLEAYTSILLVNKEKLVRVFPGRTIHGLY